MPYYKISYESDSLEGLKELMHGNAGSNTGNAVSEGPIVHAEPPPDPSEDISNTPDMELVGDPPPQADGNNSDAASDITSEPPPVLDHTPASDVSGTESGPPPVQAGQQTDGTANADTPPPLTGNANKQLASTAAKKRKQSITQSSK